MASFSRAYRDQNSPLTPLTPLSANSSFTFNFGSVDTLKPFNQPNEGQRLKETSRLSSIKMPSSIKYVNPDKYINRHLENIKSNNVKPKEAVSNKKLTPRFVSNKKVKVEVTNFDCSPDSSVHHMETYNYLKANKLQSKYAPTTSLSTTQRDNLTTARPPQSTFRSKVANSSSYSNEPSNSDMSFTKRKATNYPIPPKLVIDPPNGDNAAAMSCIFNWVFNQLSPMNNLTIYELLTRVGMQKYWKIFEREEICDLSVFSTLTMADLKTIGINSSSDCLKILKSVKMAIDFLSGLLVLKKS